MGEARTPYFRYLFANCVSSNIVVSPEKQLGCNDTMWELTKITKPQAI